MPEIDIESEAIDLQTYWAVRNAQILVDRDIINLVKPIPTTNNLKWVSNEPKVFYDTAVALLSAYPPRFRLPLTINFTPEEKNKMNKTERFLLGIFRNLDRRQMNRGQSYWLRELAYWICSGWYALFSICRKNTRGEIEFVADMWDPLTVYPEWDSEKLIRCVRQYDADRRTALAVLSDLSRRGAKFELPDIVSSNQIKIINYWRDDGDIYNAISIGGVIVKPLTKEKGLNRIPIFTGAVGSPEKVTAGWMSREGENIIASNRDVYEYENHMISLMATIMSETAYPNLVSKTKAGKPIMEGLTKGYGEEIPIKPEESIELLKHATTPTEASILLGWAGKQRQKGSVPEMVYGAIPFELSGFAISQLLSAIRYKIGPYLNTMQYVISEVASELLSQYRDKNYPPIQLTTTNPRELQKGLFFVEKFESMDVPETLFVDVTIPITSPLDKTQQMLFARQALQPPQLLSKETLWDEVLDIQDSEQEYTRIIQDQTMEMEIVKQITMVESLKEEVLKYRAQGKVAAANALERYIMALEMQLGMRKSVIQKPGEIDIPPQVMPPEMVKSPDMLRASIGIGPPGLARRPQSSEEREESKNRLITTEMMNQ